MSGSQDIQVMDEVSFFAKIFVCIKRLANARRA